MDRKVNKVMDQKANVEIKGDYLIQTLEEQCNALRSEATKYSALARQLLDERDELLAEIQRLTARLDAQRVKTDAPQPAQESA